MAAITDEIYGKSRDWMFRAICWRIQLVARQLMSLRGRRFHCMSAAKVSSARPPPTTTRWWLKIITESVAPWAVRWHRQTAATPVDTLITPTHR